MLFVLELGEGDRCLQIQASCLSLAKSEHSQSFSVPLAAAATDSLQMGSPWRRSLCGDGVMQYTLEITLYCAICSSKRCGKVVKK